MDETRFVDDFFGFENPQIGGCIVCHKKLSSILVTFSKIRSIFLFLLEIILRKFGS